jgi:hypothetical protein
MRPIWCLVLPAVAALEACQGDSLAFPMQPLSCSLSAASTGMDAAPLLLTDADVHVIVRDLSTRVVPTLAAGDGRTEIAARLSRLDAELNAATPLAQCLAIEATRRALAGVPATPETQGDLVVIALSLDVVAAHVARKLP